MVTQADEAKGFTELLRESREAMERHLKGQLPDLTDPTVQAHLTAEESLACSLMGEGAAEARAELFDTGARHGLSQKEITVALLRPIARAIRPTLPVGGCTCLRCQARSGIR